MWYVGLDVHLRRSTFCVLDENGKKMRNHTVRGSWNKVLRELDKSRGRSRSVSRPRPDTGISTTSCAGLRVVWQWRIPANCG